MSGGHFDYNQYKIGYIADEIEDLIRYNDDDTEDDWGCVRGRGYPKEVIEKFKEGLKILRQAQIYAHRIDWLVSCDDGEESFMSRLKHDLKQIGDLE